MVGAARFVGAGGLGDALGFVTLLERSQHAETLIADHVDVRPLAAIVDATVGAAHRFSAIARTNVIASELADIETPGFAVEDPLFEDLSFLDEVRDRDRYWGWTIGTRYAEPLLCRELVGLSGLRDLV